MPKTDSEQELLETCIQDLYAGCVAFHRRFPPVASQARSSELGALMIDLPGRAGTRARRLADFPKAAAGPENLWMAGILDDAQRDTQTIAQGPLLDCAMIGAVRKAVAAELVSYDTAIVVARRLAAEIVAALQDNRSQLVEADDELHRFLVDLLPATPATGDIHARS